jgi:hypothetical protein
VIPETFSLSLKMPVVKSQKKSVPTKRASKVKGTSRKKVGHSFEKAWTFWRDAQVDLSHFKFDREEANAR